MSAAARYGAAILAVTLATSCASAEHPSPKTHSLVRVSRTRSYGAVRELTRDAETVVVARATARSSVEYVGTVPFTVTSLDDVRVVRGVAVGSSVDVRQVGSVSQPLEGGVLLEAGRTYLLFLMAQRDRSGTATGRYGIVGLQAGMYAAVGDDVFARTDVESPGLPERLTLSDVTG